MEPIEVTVRGEMIEVYIPCDCAWVDLTREQAMELLEKLPDAIAQLAVKVDE